MKLTTLNLDSPPAPEARRQGASAARIVQNCPQCGGGAHLRIDGGGFGPRKLTLCGQCGYEFPKA
jgi:hypothetical protein